MPPLQPASILAAQLEPYKKLLGVLIRQDCVSLAISNSYLNLAEPLGGLMLRDGRLSERALQRLLASQQQDIAGYVVGYEVNNAVAQQHQQQQLGVQQHETTMQLQAQQPRAVHQVEAALDKLGLRGGWYGSWCSDAGGASCSAMSPAPAGPAAAAAEDSALRRHQQSQDHDAVVHSSSQDRRPHSTVSADAAAAAIRTAGGAGSGRGAQERCSLGQQFLQHYLESLGSLNTFG